jgi:hypothetical protein
METLIRANTVLLLAAGAIVLLRGLLIYIGVPVSMRLGLKIPVETQLLPFPLDDPSLPMEIAQDFHAVIDQLRPAGFEPIAGLANQQSNAISGSKSIMLLLANRQAKDVATAVVTYMESTLGTGRGKPPVQLCRSSSVEIVSDFRCGRNIATTNVSSDLTPYPQCPMCLATLFPGMKDAARLYRLHQALVARSAFGDKVLRLDEEFQGDGAAALAAVMVEDQLRMVRIGYWYSSPSEKVYRPTWKGAFLTSWNLVWPMKTIRRAAVYRKARRLLAELEAERGSPV